MSEYSETVLHPICRLCSADLSALAKQVPALDWRDERERELGGNAWAQQQHFHEHHRVTPAVGDIIMYYFPWRSIILGHGPVVVRDVRAVDLNADARARGYEADELPGTRYHLADPERPNRYGGMYWPSTGRPDDPVTFTLVKEYVPAPAQVDLLGLLGDEWQITEEDDA